MITQKHIDYVMDTFDFEKVHRAIVALKWKYSTGSERSIPELFDIKQTARDVIATAIQYGTQCKCGGFKASIKDEDVLVLEFIIEESNSYN